MEETIHSIMMGDGNIFSVAGRVKKALQKSGVSSEKQKEYTEKLFKCGSYDEALALSMNTLEEAGYEK